MASFTQADLEKLAQLAHLEMPPDELAQLRGDIEKILEYFNRIKDVDVTGLEPMQHPFDAADVWREDVVQPSLTVEEALRNAPHRIESFFAFPRIVPTKRGEASSGTSEPDE